MLMNRVQMEDAQPQGGAQSGACACRASGGVAPAVAAGAPGRAARVAESDQRCRCLSVLRLCLDAGLKQDQLGACTRAEGSSRAFTQDHAQQWERFAFSTAQRGIMRSPAAAGVRACKWWASPEQGLQVVVRPRSKAAQLAACTTTWRRAVKQATHPGAGSWGRSGCSASAARQRWCPPPAAHRGQQRQQRDEQSRRRRGSEAVLSMGSRCDALTLSCLGANHLLSTQASLPTLAMSDMVLPSFTVRRHSPKCQQEKSHHKSPWQCRTWCRPPSRCAGTRPAPPQRRQWGRWPAPARHARCTPLPRPPPAACHPPGSAVGVPKSSTVTGKQDSRSKAEAMQGFAQKALPWEACTGAATGCSPQPQQSGAAQPALLAFCSLVVTRRTTSLGRFTCEPGESKHRLVSHVGSCRTGHADSSAAAHRSQPCQAPFPLNPFLWLCRLTRTLNPQCKRAP